MIVAHLRSTAISLRHWRDSNRCPRPGPGSPVPPTTSPPFVPVRVLEGLTHRRLAHCLLSPALTDSVLACCVAQVLVLDGGNIDDGTFNQLAYEGAAAACTEAASCCLEVDRVDDDVEQAETKFFCELEYAATDSDLTIGVGFLHEQSVHRAATCMPHKDFGIVDVAYTASLPNLEGLTFADDQAGYLAGVIAGGVAAPRSKKVGVIGGLPIMPVKRFINGFANGVAYSCSDCRR